MIYSKLRKKKKSQTKILYPAKFSFKDEEEIKIFPYKQTQGEFVTRKYALQEILMGLL